MKVVSVINYKGGVGKTIVTANLAAYVASQGKRVLMIDLDPQTNLTFSFMNRNMWQANYAQNRTLKNFFNPIIYDSPDKVTLYDLVIPLNIRGVQMGLLSLISSHLELIDIDINLASTISAPAAGILAANFLKGHSHLRKGLSEMKDNYDLVLIDCPPNFYTVVKNAIAASDYYIAPSKMDYLSTLGIEQLDKNVVQFVTQYNQFVTDLNDNNTGISSIFTKILGVVPTMVTIKNKRPIKDNQLYIDQVRKDGYYLFPWIKHNTPTFGSAPANDVPVVLMTGAKVTRSATAGAIEELKKLGKDFMEKVEL